MSSRKFFFILIALFTRNCSVLNADESHVFLKEEEEAAQKFTAANEARLVNEKLKDFGDDYGKRWIIMADGNDLPELALMQPDKGNSSEKTILPSWTLDEMPDHVKLYLHTKKNPEGQKLDPENLEGIDYDPSKMTKIICHGWRAESNSSGVKSIQDAYLEKQDVNVIGVDWSSLSKDILYPRAVAATKVVGQYVGTVINTLVEEKGAKYDDFHIIGHSLGAHVAGFAGQTTNQKIGRITGLDPALPGFQYLSGPENRLDSSNANFVDVIHTCSGVLGMSILVGHADFYPNGGSPFQPGCIFTTITPQICSHSRSQKYFAESIRHSDFKAISCENYSHFTKNDCYKIYADMGEYISPNANGSFYLATSPTYPFAKGIGGTIY